MKMKNHKHINLFEILGNEGEFGLINYLKSSDDENLKILAYQYSVNPSIKDREGIIKGVLSKVERTMNIGWVFRDSGSEMELVKLYK